MRQHPDSRRAGCVSTLILAGGPFHSFQLSSPYVRSVAATNKNLEDEQKESKFREDLYFRLNVITIQLPTLKERPKDIP